MNEPSNSGSENKIISFFDHSSFFTVLLLVILLAASLFVIVAPNPADSLELQAGQVAPYRQYADVEFTTEDWQQNREIADRLAEKEPDYYKIRESATQELEARLEDFFSQLKRRETLEKIGKSYQPAENAPLQEQTGKISGETLKFLLDVLSVPNRKKELEQLIGKSIQEGILAQDAYDKIGDKQIKIIDPQYRRHKVSKDKLITPKEAGSRIAEEMLLQYESPAKEQIQKEVGRSLTLILAPGNLFFDQVFTENRRKEVRAGATKLYKVFHQNDIIFEKDQKLTEDDVRNLEACRRAEQEQKGPMKIYKIVGQNILLCLVLIVVLGLYLFRTQPAFRQSNRMLWQLGLIIVAGLLLNRLGSNVFLFLTKLFNHVPQRELVYFVMPMGFSAVVISVIFGARTAFFAGLFVSAVAALPVPQKNQFLMFFSGLLINAVGALAVREVKNYRSYFVRTFVSISLATLLVAVMFQLKYLHVTFSSKPDQFFYLMLFPFATGLLTALLALLGLFLLEMIFDVNTPMALQSFYDFNHPLLKELQLNAPGTYHHCLMVSTLAEKAAEEAGLNPIKARVCGMFHDVGKLVQPDYFVENSRGQDMHRNLDPKMSALIIRSHVATHGPEMARKYKLKRLLYDTITQHHGNGVISFFFKKEKDLHPGEIVSDRDFRYPGPIPSDREISLVMLADCCEAACRSLDH